MLEPKPNMTFKPAISELDTWTWTGHPAGGQQLVVVGAFRDNIRTDFAQEKSQKAQ